MTKDKRTRQEVERKLMNLLEEAEKIAKEYSPKGGGLSMRVKDGEEFIYNEASYEHNDKAIDVMRTKDGEVWSFGWGEIK